MLKTRLPEHKRDLRLGHTTMYTNAYHAHSQIDCRQVVWEQKFYRRRVKEAIHIRHTANFNQDEGLQLAEYPLCSI